MLSTGDDPELLLSATATAPKNPFLSGTIAFQSHAPLVDTTVNGCAAMSRDGSLSSTPRATPPGRPVQALPVTAGHPIHILP